MHKSLRKDKEFFQAMQCVQRAFEAWEKAYFLPKDESDTEDTGTTGGSSRTTAPNGTTSNKLHHPPQQLQFESVEQLLKRAGQKVENIQEKKT